MKFSKYHGTGNDFILIDNRDGAFRPSQQFVAQLCHRHFGIGADGLMLLENAIGFDFKMVYYNSDGNESSMCGNGGRCITAFAQRLSIIESTARFTAIDGVHTATLLPENIVSLHMQDVTNMDIHDGFTTLNTGSPHYVTWVKDLEKIEVKIDGRTIRYQEEFAPGGLNVNFVQVTANNLHVRTYERGVEDETLSCGTGVTAAAIASTCHGTGTFTTNIETPGGKLIVSFRKLTPTSATDVVLTGSATFVFEGEIYAG